MAKKRRPLRENNKQLSASTNTGYSPPSRVLNAFTAVSSDNFTSRRAKGVQRARAKHANDNIKEVQVGVEPTLADRFNALPTELRAEILSHLLVRPVKWDVEHQHDCPRRSSVASIIPETCDVYCSDTMLWQYWREHVKEGVPATMSSWRSKWAPEQANPYLCSRCYDEKGLRPAPHPRPDLLLPCLCARRQHLEVFLVCKKWYEEAAMVFYTQNIFGFETGFSFVNFITHMNPRWKQMISHISIMVTTCGSWADEVSTWVRYEYGRQEWDSYSVSPYSASIWTRLRELPALTYLELDHRFLTKKTIVQRMQRLGLNNVKQVRFTHGVSPDGRLEWTEGTPSIWPTYAGRKLLVGGFAEEMGRAIKGQRQKSLKNKAKIERAIQDFQVEFGEVTPEPEWWEV